MVEQNGCCSGKQALSPTFHTGPESLVAATLCIDTGQEHILAAYGCKDLTNLMCAGSGSSSAPAQSQAALNAQQSTGVKDGEPSTQLQIRLADGSKLTGRFNLTQTVQDVKRYDCGFACFCCPPLGNAKPLSVLGQCIFCDVCSALNSASWQQW